MAATLIVGWLHRSADRRAEWFGRVQWAHGLTGAAQAHMRASGYQALASLSRSSLANRDD